MNNPQYPQNSTYNPYMNQQTPPTPPPQYQQAPLPFPNPLEQDIQKIYKKYGIYLIDIKVAAQEKLNVHKRLKIVYIIGFVGMFLISAGNILSSKIGLVALGIVLIAGAIGLYLNEMQIKRMNNQYGIR